MKLLLFIDHLGLGGAQRQIVELACGLAQRGHSVELLTYFPQHDFFLHRIQEQGIAGTQLSQRTRILFRHCRRHRVAAAHWKLRSCDLVSEQSEHLRGACEHRVAAHATRGLRALQPSR
jgi:hypothetical protein